MLGRKEDVVADDVVDKADVAVSERCSPVMPAGQGALTAEVAGCEAALMRFRSRSSPFGDTTALSVFRMPASPGGSVSETQGVANTEAGSVGMVVARSHLSSAPLMTARTPALRPKAVAAVSRYRSCTSQSANAPLHR